MKRLAIIFVALLIVAVAGFGAGQYVMWVKVEPVLFAWIENAHNWQYEAECNQVAANFYRENAERNAFVAEILKEICDNYTAENLELLEQIDYLGYQLRKALNPNWEVSN